MLAPHRFYYLHNFLRALDWVAERYADVLNEEEQGFVAQFNALPAPSQALLVRLLMRRGPWFKARQLVYAEIGDSLQAAQPLLELGWLSSTAPLSVSELFNLHTKAELAPLLAPHAHLIAHSSRKSDWLQSLLAAGLSEQPYAAWQPQAALHDPAEPVWRVMVGPLEQRLRLMFFGNLHQDWSEFVLADLGIFHYEQVPLAPASRAFHSRADIALYLQLQEHKQALADGAPAETLLPAITACTSSNPWLQSRRAKLLLQLAQACERQQDWAAAQQVYLQCDYPGARLRRIRMHERLGQHTEALQLALQAQQAPESEEESQRLERMLPRLRRSLALPAMPRPERAPDIARLHLSLPRPASPTPVEVVAQQALRAPDSSVHYVENALINSLFGLLCWPAIFAPLPGAFFHPFQRGPADFSAADFVARRETLFAACLAELDSGSYRQTILQRYTDKRDLQSPCVFWSAIDLPLLQLALDCIPARDLRLFFHRLLNAPKANRTGFADLIRFWPAQQRYQLIEVKGPGDKLQDNQLRWLQYCAAQGMDVTVCHVQWQSEATP